MLWESLLGMCLLEIGNSLKRFFLLWNQEQKDLTFSFFLSIMWGKTEKRPSNMDAQNIRPFRPLLYVYIVFIIYFWIGTFLFVINMIVREERPFCPCMLDRHTVPGHAGRPDCKDSVSWHAIPAHWTSKMSLLPGDLHVLSVCPIWISSQKGHTFCPNSLFEHNGRSKYA